MPTLSNEQQIGILVGIFKLKGYQAPFQLQPLHSGHVLASGTLEGCLHQYVAQCERRQGTIPEFRLLSDVRLGKPQQVYRLEFQLSHNQEEGFRVKKLNLHAMHGMCEQRRIANNWELPSIHQLVPQKTQTNRQRVLPPPPAKRRRRL
ncbi:hypothetical protein [Chitinophaga filiformis]|uniref:Uncharacterized protein n=1 Tax=Chitinophaga filiformis TaxID=104663 RepID=A0ABY4HW63_CHIFI|nr:hypothetical protein [Chitinophaga filiformis]UPK68029.1 hypothetical protein MYF79_24045 [Chitinophaga filiformis]